MSCVRHSWSSGIVRIDKFSSRPLNRYCARKIYEMQFWERHLYFKVRSNKLSMCPTSNFNLYHGKHHISCTDHLVGHREVTLSLYSLRLSPIRTPERKEKWHGAVPITMVFILAWILLETQTRALKFRRKVRNNRAYVSVKMDSKKVQAQGWIFVFFVSA